MKNAYIISSNLKKCSLFYYIKDEDIITLLYNNENHIKNYVENDILSSQNEKCNYLSIVLSGQVQIQKLDSSGNVLIVSTLKCNDVFGENLLFGDYNNYPMFVVCKKDASILHISKKQIFSMCKNDKEFLKEFLKILSNKAIILNSKLKQISMKSLRGMICSFLITQYKLQQTSKIEIGITKKELAEKLGVQRPSLSRELMKMKKEHLIDYDKKYIVLLDVNYIKSQI